MFSGVALRLWGFSSLWKLMKLVDERVFDKDMCGVRMLAAPFSELVVIGIE